MRRIYLPDFRIYVTTIIKIMVLVKVQRIDQWNRTDSENTRSRLTQISLIEFFIKLQKKFNGGKSVESKPR